MPDISAWSSDDWSAFASVGTFAVALLATVFAFFQLRSRSKAVRQAREAAAQQERLTAEATRQAAQAAAEQSRLAISLAEEESRPYVMVFLDSGRDGDPTVIDLVVRNFGRTAAYDVRVRCDPPLQRSLGDNGEPEDVWLPATIPTLVPGQEWRTLFDFGFQRSQSGLPDVYRVTISIHDSQGRQLPDVEAVLDWSQYSGRMWTTVRTMHDAATALKEIEKHIKGWREGASGGLRVFVRDGDARDERNRAEFNERQGAHEALRARVLPDRQDGDRQDTSSSD